MTQWIAPWEWFILLTLLSAAGVYVAYSIDKTIREECRL